MLPSSLNDGVHEVGADALELRNLAQDRRTLARIGAGVVAEAEHLGLPDTTLVSPRLEVLVERTSAFSASAASSWAFFSASFAASRCFQAAFTTSFASANVGTRAGTSSIFDARYQSPLRSRASRGSKSPRSVKTALHQRTLALHVAALAHGGIDQLAVGEQRRPLKRQPASLGERLEARKVFRSAREASS